MSEHKPWPAAALAGLVALAALIGCGRQENVASRSAAAFEEAQERGETFGGEGHAHGGHQAALAGGEPAGTMPEHPAAGEEHHAGHDMAAAPAAGGMRHEAGHEGMDHAAHGAGGGTPAEHSAMGHGAGAQSGGHAGHGAPAAQAPAGGHAGHPAAGGAAPPRPVETLPAQPAGILRPDAVDAPAATSVLDAQRSAEMNQEMSGGMAGHGGHGAASFRQLDAGRAPGADEGSQPQTPAAGPQHPGHGAPAQPPEHSHAPAPGEKATLYTCPMHPEILSKTPGTCPICGMTLVERREE